MMRRLSSVLCVAALGMYGGGCAKQTDAPGSSTFSTGSVQLGLAIADGIDIDTVSYSVEIPGYDSLSGELPVPEDGSELLGSIVGVPPASGVLVSLNAASDDGVTCAGSGTVDVVPGEPTAVFIVLQCRLPDGTDLDTGTIDLSGGFNVCPQLEAASADESYGPSINVAAEASDLDGDAVTFAWSADAGSFDDASAAETVYACDASGEQTLTVVVDDGQGCTHSAEVLVNCADVVVEPVSACGDGTVDEGEACDDGNTEDGDGCAADCTVEPAPPACGDGAVDEGEACDDGNTEDGDGCAADCTVEPAPPVCGDGAVDEGEACDDGNTEDGDGCAADCTVEEPPVLALCEAEPANDCEACGCELCADEMSACNSLTGVAEAGRAEGTAKSELCQAVVTCGRENGCRGSACFCGEDVDLVTCLTGGAAGPCMDPIFAAAETENPQEVSQRQSVPGFAIAAANSVSTCTTNSCADRCE